MFELGQVVITRGANELLNHEDVQIKLAAHKSGDFGSVGEDSVIMNKEAIETGNDYILSIFKDRNDNAFWIKTEWDRSVTTIYLPEEN